MTLRRQNTYHLARNVSFTDDGHAVKVAYFDLLGVAGLARQSYLCTSDMCLEATFAGEKRSNA